MSRTIQRRRRTFFERRAADRIEIEVQIVGPIDVVAARVPLVKIDAPRLMTHINEATSWIIGKSIEFPDSCSMAQISIQSGRGAARAS